MAEAIEASKRKYANGLLGLWRHYYVMLSLDIPFQIINFVLFGFLSDAVLKAGFDLSFLSRLFCGITCGMISAGLTCPIDVSKTRIIARDRAANATGESSNLSNSNVINEMVKIVKDEGVSTLFLGFKERLLYTGLANGIRLSAYGTSRLDIMMKSLDKI